jgi:RNA polymerase sigma factor (sigma-70 family)
MATVERFEADRESAVRPADEARAAFERLYLGHHARVLAICTSILRNRCEAEDAAQEVFVSALRSLLAGTVPREPGAWLATIARHECWARGRREASAPLRPVPDSVGEEDPAAIAVRRAELLEIWRTIAELPGAQRDVLLLREVRGLRYDELAEDLHLSHASVRSLLNRARRAVRMNLERGAAVISGAPWLNALVRWFGDGPSPVASSATRAAAVGLGALVLSGGAVVAPTVTAHPQADAGAAGAMRQASGGQPGPPLRVSALPVHVAASERDPAAHHGAHVGEQDRHRDRTQGGRDRRRSSGEDQPATSSGPQASGLETSGGESRGGLSSDGEGGGGSGDSSTAVPGASGGSSGSGGSASPGPATGVVPAGSSDGGSRDGSGSGSVSVSGSGLVSGSGSVSGSSDGGSRDGSGSGSGSVSGSGSGPTSDSVSASGSGSSDAVTTVTTTGSDGGGGSDGSSRVDGSGSSFGPDGSGGSGSSTGGS